MKKLETLLYGLVACVMISLCGMGDGLNLRCFLGAERVYDFSVQELTKSSSGWEYQEEEQYFLLNKNGALHRYLLDGKTDSWKCLLITVDKLSLPAVEALIVYYDKAGEVLAEQQAELVCGENRILLYEDVAMYRMGIRIFGAKGEYISVGSMQIRDGLPGFSPQMFAAVTGILYVLFVTGCIFWWRFEGKKKKEEKNFAALTAVNMLQDLYINFGNSMWRHTAGKVRPAARKTVRGILFSLFPLWIIFCGALGWSEGDFYRYFAGTIAVMLLASGLFTIERPLKRADWNTNLARIWLVLWLFVTVSDIFVDAGDKFLGYLMLFSGGFFIFVWNQTRKPAALLAEIMTGLELCFGLTIVFCMLFRQKKTAVYYNGVFTNAEDFAMYSLLMLAVFLTEFGRALREKKTLRSWVLYGIGAAASLYFTARAGGATAFTALALVTATAGWRLIEYYRGSAGALKKDLRRNALQIAAACTAALFAAVCIHSSVKYLPRQTGMNINFEEEQCISVLPEEELELYRMLLPEELEGVVSQDTLEIGTYQKSYARLLGLTGNIADVRVYREKVKAYSGYLSVMYRYGMLTAVPFLLFQIYAVGAAVKKRRWFLLMTDIVYICFCVGGNAGMAMTQPLTWCFYLLNGWCFAGKSDKTD